MFSEEATTPSHGHSLRPKRSRQTGSDDSIKLPRAKRRRSALRRDTFKPLSDLSPNEVAISENGSIPINGHPPEDNSEHDAAFPRLKELTFRAAKKVEKRSERGSGTMTLASNDFYKVEQLPALPDQIRSRPTLPYSSTICSRNGYGLALSHSEALVWNYNSSSTTPSTKDLLSFKLPFPPSATTDPLPLGIFAAKSVGTEPGLVVVEPNKGRIVYWETITNASAFMPGQTSSGVQGTVAGIFGGETITDIISAEPAGFILTFSHGRAAHLTVKDQLGRPSISVQFLRKRTNASSGGFFGSIRNMVGGDRRKPIAAVRSGKGTKGQRDVVIVTEEGELEHWSMHLHVADSLIFEHSLKDDLLEALNHNLPNDLKHNLRFRILDFALMEISHKGDELAHVGGESSYPILLLASLTHQNTSTFYIVEAHISSQGSTVSVVHPISCYKTPVPEPLGWKPRLCVPRPGDIAFVVFETTIVIFSLAKVEETPSSQLLMEGQRLPEPFQDCIKFQDDTIYRVLGCTAEEKDSPENSPSCVFAVQGFGLVRVTSLATPTPKEISEEVKIGLKSKIEQAIFYGTLRQNPLDLSNTEQCDYPAEEVEEAALNISHEILSSTSKYIPKTSPSLDHHLKLRAKALEDLVLHLLKRYGPLPRNLKWKLLWGAEKLAAAQSMWKIQEEIMKRKVKERSETYWEQLLFFMDSSYRTNVDKTKGETDWIRLFLTKDIYRIEYFLNWLFEGHKEVKEDNFLGEQDMFENIRESCDLWIAGFEAAYKFREDNAPLYGLEDEIFDAHQGILKSSYRGLPEAWTTSALTVNRGECLLELVFQTIQEGWDASKTSASDTLKQKSLVHMAHALPQEVDLCQRMLAERYTWLMEQDHIEFPEYLIQARKLTVWGNYNRREYFYKIARLGLIEEALDLAEQWKDMKGLVELRNLAEEQLIHGVKEGPAPSAVEVEDLEEQMRSIHARTEGYFERYGSDWATEHFNKMVTNGQLGSLLVEGQTDEKKQPYLSQFLLKHPGYQKISWINDLIGEQNFEHAAKTLETLATKKVNDLWTTKTELSLAKLTRLASAEKDSKTATTRSTISTKKFDDGLAVLDLQDRLHSQVTCCIGPVIDASGARQVALEMFGKRLVGDKKYPALRGLLNDGLSLLLRDKVLPPERLIDVLTLMDHVPYDASIQDDPQILGHEFWLSLMVLLHGDVELSVSEGLTAIVWRRAMIRDDWIVLNDTTDKNDEQVTAAMTQSSLFQTLFDYYRHIQQRPEDSSTIKLLSPTQILNADLFSKSLQKRFRENEVELVRRDLEAENKVLKGYVDKGRLELHYGGLLKMAQAAVREEADRAGDEAASEMVKA